MTITSGGGEGKVRLNPFHLPDPIPTVLCPWMEPSHRDFYVPVDHTEKAFTDFVDAMGDLGAYLQHGRLALVTGESGCGKSAVINRCADWVVRQLAQREGSPTGKVVDLTRTLNGRPQQTIDDRLSIVCDALFNQFRGQDLLKPGALEQLKSDRDQPDRIYPILHKTLRNDRALIILLPDPGELADEVIRYSGLTCGKVLFLAESALLDTGQVDAIRWAQRNWIQPITLQVGPLQSGDLRAFALDRLRRHVDKGLYPQLSDETMDSVTPLLQSVDQLQRALSETYETRRLSGLPYDQDSWVTADEIRQQVRKWLGDGL